jgi:hypothetical protein
VKKQSKSKDGQLTSVPKGKDIVHLWTRKAGPMKHKNDKRKKQKERKFAEEEY